MTSIRATKHFDKAYAKRIGRDSKLRGSYVSRASLLKEGKPGYQLKGHALTGRLFAFQFNISI